MEACVEWTHNLDAWHLTALNAVAAENAKGVIQLGQSIVGCGVTAVSEEPVSLEQARGANEAVGVPPK